MKKDIFHSIGLITYILLVFFITNTMQTYQRSNFNYIPYLTVLILLAINIVFGVLMGLDSYLSEYKKSGTWEVNTTRLLFMGIPSLIIACLFYIYHSPLIFNAIGKLYKYYNVNIGFSFTATTMGQVLFGYSLITSFNKKEESKSYPDPPSIREIQDV